MPVVGQQIEEALCNGPVLVLSLVFGLIFVLKFRFLVLNSILIVPI